MPPAPASDRQLVSSKDNLHMTIRELRETDRDEWVRMRDLLWPGNREGHITEIDAFFAAPPPDEVVFVAGEGNGRLMGFVEASIANRADGCDGLRIGCVDGWYVDENRRKLGVGRLQPVS